MSIKLEELTQDKLDELLGKFDALEESNKGLKADLFKAKAKAKGAEIDPDEYANLQQQVADLSSRLENEGKHSKKEIERLSNLTKKKIMRSLHTYLRLTLQIHWLNLKLNQNSWMLLRHC